ncbi:hypothetical protein AVHM3334_05385 [Acidovorax sp. SUPP3334]|nr:hypothetical protein AVHM3334_05385 [Acidovorax sp. SUPP3334]
MAESDGAVALAFAAGTQHDAVAVLQEGALFAVVQHQGALSALRQFEQRAALVRPRPGLRARAQQIARLQVAAPTVWCASNCATVQYESAKLERISRWCGRPLPRIAAV